MTDQTGAGAMPCIWNPAHLRFGLIVLVFVFVLVLVLVGQDVQSAAGAVVLVCGACGEAVLRLQSPTAVNAGDAGK